MKKEEKTQLIENLTEQLKDVNCLYITDISGLDVETTNQLRRLCFKRDVKLVVVKNTLLKKALQNTGRDYSDIYPILNGPTSIMTSEHANDPAKLIQEFRKNNKKPLLKGAFVQESAYIGDDQLLALVSLKSRNELIGDLVALLQSPARNVISSLQSGGGKLAGILKTLSEK